MNSKREYPIFPIAGVGVLIQKDDRYLLIKRAANPDKGLWSVPGGLVEVGERVADAVVREALEETGLVEIKERIGVFDKIEHDAKDKVLYHFVILHFLAYPVEGEIKPMDDALDAIRVTKEQLKEYAITPSLRTFLENIGFL